MANICLILGKSGTGKSSSIEKLDPKTTVVLNVLGKKLPFKGSSKIYNEENKNLFRIDEYSQAISMLEGIDKGASYVKNVILDDATYIIRKEYFKRAKEGGYNKYTELALHFQQLIATCEKMREDLNVFFIMHSEDVVSDNAIVGYKVSTVGKLLDSQYNIVEVVPMVLYSDITYNDKGEATYGFYTHKFKEGVVEIPAKTPRGMFDADFIPNDLSLVVEAMNNYYN